MAQPKVQSFLPFPALLWSPWAGLTAVQVLAMEEAEELLKTWKRPAACARSAPVGGGAAVGIIFGLGTGSMRASKETK